jgi:hypothetical protein
MKNLIWILIAAFVLPINAQNRKKSQAIADQNVANWRYDVICNGSGGTDTSYLLDVSVYVPNANLGLETAKKSAIHAVLFKGVTGNNTGCDAKSPLAGTNAEFENADYFNAFFLNSAMYSKFATVPTGVPQNVQALDKKGKSLRMDFVVSVNIDVLRKQLEADGIIASLAVDENVKKPSITILPDKNFLVGTMKYFKTNSRGEKIPDYDRAYQDNDIRTAIAKLESLLQERGFQPINAFAANEGAIAEKAQNQVFSGKEGGGRIEVDNFDKLISGAKADIYWEFDWKINDTGFDKKLNYTVRANDAYLKTAIATETGEGPSSFSASIPELLTQAITDKIDGFLKKHQTHFKDIIDNGRLVKLTFLTAGNPTMGADYYFDTLIEDEYGETELGDLIIGYVGNFSVKSRDGVANFSTERTQTTMTLTNVRIPLEIAVRSRYGESYISNDATQFLKAMQSDFRRNLDIDGTIITIGLGEARFIIGGK